MIERTWLHSEGAPGRRHYMGQESFTTRVASVDHPRSYATSIPRKRMQLPGKLRL